MTLPLAGSGFRPSLHIVVGLLLLLPTQWSHLIQASSLPIDGTGPSSDGQQLASAAKAASNNSNNFIGNAKDNGQLRSVATKSVSSSGVIASAKQLADSTADVTAATSQTSSTSGDVKRATATSNTGVASSDCKSCPPAAAATSSEAGLPTTTTTTTTTDANLVQTSASSSNGDTGAQSSDVGESPVTELFNYDHQLDYTSGKQAGREFAQTKRQAAIAIALTPGGSSSSQAPASEPAASLATLPTTVTSTMTIMTTTSAVADGLELPNARLAAPSSTSVQPDEPAKAYATVQGQQASARPEAFESATASLPTRANQEPAPRHPAASQLEMAATDLRKRVADVATSAIEHANGDAADSAGVERPSDDSNARLINKQLGVGSVTGSLLVNKTAAYQGLLAKKAYSKYWSAEEKWDDLFKRLVKLQELAKAELVKNHFLKNIEHYADIGLSASCANDMKFVRHYAENSTNFRWLLHMFDSMGKNEPGMLTGNVAHLGHVIQCIKVRAPGQASNHSLDERYFERQTEMLGERFRGKYCLASIRPVMPSRPRLVSRLAETFNLSLLSNISYNGQPPDWLEARARSVDLLQEQMLDAELINKTEPYQLEQVPFESEFYQFIIEQRNLMYSLPRFLGVCFPSSCSRDDVRLVMQKSYDEEHQVVDIEFECEQEQPTPWSWLNTVRLLVYVTLALIVLVSSGASILRYVLIDKLQLKRQLQEAKLASDNNNINKLASLVDLLDLISMDKCVGVLFVKTKRATSIVDGTKLENLRSTSIDSLRGLLIVLLVYSKLVYLGCLPVPFMWSKWGTAMFPFYRSLWTQLFLNSSIWSGAFYLISAYLIGLKFLENHRPSIGSNGCPMQARAPNWPSFVLKRYIRLVMPMLGFMLMSYVWIILSNGFVLQDQANKMTQPCDSAGWTNLLLFHNFQTINEICLWPSHVSASFFQLHLLSLPIMALLLYSLKTTCSLQTSSKFANLHGYLGLGLMATLSTFGLWYPAWQASERQLIVPFLIDYFDYDNYRRVIELTVMPTYNHLLSYMLGLLIAYAVVKRRSDRELRKALGSEWQGTYITRLDSFESLTSSSAASTLTYAHDAPQQKTGNNICSSQRAHQQHHQLGPLTMRPSVVRSQTSTKRATFGLVGTLLAGLACFVSLTASWFWNGLGQPMNPNQTFWYLVLTRLAFNVSFASLFWRYFALRKNVPSPWMLTRFLVPIGRMSLTVFYLAWLVVWFDLLTSLYQWHPSHYFVFEKFNEILFITLVMSLIAYGVFEGPIKRIQYKRWAAELARHLLRSNGSYDAANSTTSATTSGDLQQGFEFLFTTSFDSGAFLQEEARARSHHQKSDATKQQPKVGINNKLISATTGGKPGDNSWQDQHELQTLARNCQQQQAAGLADVKTSGGHFISTIQVNNGPGGEQQACKSSISDHYKLNAELRANYSFISLGMYEMEKAGDNVSRQSIPAAPDSHLQSTQLIQVHKTPPAEQRCHPASQ